MGRWSGLAGRAKKGLLKTRTAQRLTAPLGRDPQPERWIFVVSCYNSGTTLLRSVLDRHPRITSLPSEGVRLTDVLPRPEDFGWPRLWCRCLDQVRLEVGADGARRAERIKRHWSFFHRRQAPNLLEKSIANAARLPFLQAYFQPAYFIYIVRNGYAVAEGIQRKAQPGARGNDQYGQRYPMELCAEQWAATDRLVQRDRSGLDHFLSIYYEDLAANPVASARRITDFLGLAPLPDKVFGQQWKVHGVESSIRNMNGASLGGCLPQISPVLSGRRAMCSNGTAMSPGKSELPHRIVGKLKQGQRAVAKGPG